ncbi:unnamed protein product [Amoebophrya sp. A25]|nr:unnamed protein product [Amoebophrya sp. A25]|eukprot:GSA25T00016784001.1
MTSTCTPTTSRLYFLRHCESGNNARGSGVARQPDPPLTERGEQQQKHLAERLLQLQGEEEPPSSTCTSGSGRVVPKKFRQILISPMCRTVRTASSIVQKILLSEPDDSATSSTSYKDVKISIEPSLCEEGGYFQGERHSTATGTAIVSAEVLDSGVDETGQNLQVGRGRGMSFKEVRSLLLSSSPTTPTSTSITSSSSNFYNISNGNEDTNEDSTTTKTLADARPMKSLMLRVEGPTLKVGDGNESTLVGEGDSGSSGPAAWGGDGDIGWWPRGRESLTEYHARCQHVADFLIQHSLKFNDSLFVTHGKFLDGLLKAFFGMDQAGGRASPVAGPPTFLTGGGCLTCIQIESGTGRVAVDFMNFPLLPLELRTGHKSSGFAMDAWI